MDALVAAGALLTGIGLSGIGVAAAVWSVRRRPKRREEPTVVAVAQHVRAVGKLVALEVCAKEIATSMTGWDGLPILLWTPAKLAMIFTFEKQYAVDLSRLGPEDVDELGPGRYRLRLPAIEASLRLTDLTPYDIQAGRVLGLVDVVRMTADRQKKLITRAQEEASKGFAQADAKYRAAAKEAVERHMASLLGLFGIRAEVAWADEPATEAGTHDVVIESPAAIAMSA